MAAVVVEAREDEVYVTIANGWRLETWLVAEHWRQLVDVVDAS